MPVVSWSRLGGTECIRVHHVDRSTRLEVRPESSLDGLPAMAGETIPDGPDLCFIPQFAFRPGLKYVVSAEDVGLAVLGYAPDDRPATTEVVEIYPTAFAVPRNLLRCYVLFSGPMSEGQAARAVRLVGEDGRELSHTLLATEHELWDSDHRRLTVLLDPARIKRDLITHRELGYPLRVGQTVRLVVAAGFADASGRGLRAPAERSYTVAADERGFVDPQEWAVDIPRRGSHDRLTLTFPRPLDHALLADCLQVRDSSARPVDGVGQAGPQQSSWEFRPRRPWTGNDHHVVVDTVLEDLAGNSAVRVFDRELADPAQTPRTATELRLPFRPS